MCDLGTGPAMRPTRSASTPALSLQTRLNRDATSQPMFSPPRGGFAVSAFGGFAVSAFVFGFSLGGFAVSAFVFGFSLDSGISWPLFSYSAFTGLSTVTQCPDAGPAQITQNRSRKRERAKTRNVN